MTRKISWLLSVAVTATAALAAPDEQALGKGQNYPVGGFRNWTQPPFRVGSWSAPHKIEGIAHAKVDKSSQALALEKAPLGVGIQYKHQLTDLSVDQYFERQKVTSLLILKDGKLLLEKYQYDRGPEARFLSFSMAKSITAVLVGVALDKALLKSLDDLAEVYSPTLRGTSYGSTRIRDLLRMASGIDFAENYTGHDDVAKLSRSVLTGTPPTIDLLKSFTRKSPAGQRFNYASLETMALGYLLKDVTGQSMAELTRAWIWEPMGAEDEAYWLLSKEGMEGAYCCFAASPRDWAKVGLLFAQDGEVKGKRIVSKDYMLEATSTEMVPPALQVGLNPTHGGYGFQTWLLPGPGRQFYLRGIHGQSVFVQAQTGLVMVHTAVFSQPSARIDAAPYEEMHALWQGVVKALGHAK